MKKHMRIFDEDVNRRILEYVEHKYSVDLKGGTKYCILVQVLLLDHWLVNLSTLCFVFNFVRL